MANIISIHRKGERDMDENKKDDFSYGRRICACCNKCVVDFYDICDICGWQNDLLQNKESDFSAGANVMSLNEAKKAYAEGRKVY